MHETMLHFHEHGITCDGMPRHLLYSSGRLSVFVFTCILWEDIPRCLHLMAPRSHLPAARAHRKAMHCHQVSPATQADKENARPVVQ